MTEVMDRLLAKSEKGAACDCGKSMRRAIFVAGFSQDRGSGNPCAPVNFPPGELFVRNRRSIPCNVGTNRSFRQDNDRFY